MKLSSRGRYAVMAMADLASQGEGRCAPLAEIAARQQISLPYLEQLFARLRKQGLVVGARGPGGGYRLANPAAEVSIAVIVEAVDEPMRATRCGGGSAGCLRGGQRCLTHGLWAGMGKAIGDYLASVSLADVASGRLNDEKAAAA